MKLNKEQKLAAQFKDGICAVIAVPGSGKTKTMMERIGMLVNKHNIQPEQILGLTFTRNAAEEMRTRLIPVLGELAEKVHLSTIHSFCHFLLRSEGETFDILFGKDQIIFIKELMKKLKINDISVGMIIREISLSKNNLISVGEFFELYGSDKPMAKVGKVYELYEKRKTAGLLKDFDDLLFDAYRLLKDNKEVREKYREIFKHLLIDEFQDTNPAQMEIIKLLLGDSNNGDAYSLWVCGDDAQSIYGFTGASVGNILHFQSVFPESEMIVLNLNYRSTPQILEACQNLIQKNERQIEKELMTKNADGEDVVVLESYSEETEAEQVANEVIDLIERNKFQYKDIAVLYRANFQSRILEEVFLQHHIPYHITSGMNFYDRFEIKILLDYLRFINDPLSEQGDEALKHIINVPNRYIGKKFVIDLEKKADNDWLHLYDQLKAMTISVPYLRKNVRAFIAFMEPLIADKEELTPAEIISIIRMNLDFDRAITDEDIPSPDDSRIQNIDQLQMAAGKYKSIDAFLKYTDTFEDAKSVNDKDGVSLMTIHKAKGLEFPVVFMVGMVSGILPNKNCDNIEEERRICFVGMSRAMQLLYLCHSTTYLGQPSLKSVFIDESLGTTEEKISQTAA